MCDVWKTRSEDELSVSDWTQTFADPLFQQMRYVGISGGEPTLRKDLVELVGVALQSFPKLQKLTITTHGFHPQRWKHMGGRIKALCSRHGVGLVVNVSLDGVGEVHDQVRGIPDGFSKVESTIRILRELEIPIQIQSTIITQNIFHLPRLEKYLSDNQINDSIFRLGVEVPRLDNQSSIIDVQLSEDQKSFFADYISSKIESDPEVKPARRLFYSDLNIRLIDQSSRLAPCFFQNEGILITALGDMYHCSISTEKIGNVNHVSPSSLYFSKQSLVIREQLLLSACPNCYHDQSGAWSPAALFGQIGFIRKLKQIMQTPIKTFLFLQNLVLTGFLALKLKFGYSAK
jgi:MoaA/NifB/PqqE/SkfB family radical SAM enzyme